MGKSDQTTRCITISEKLDRQQTGMAGAMFVHVDCADDGIPMAVHFNHKWKDEESHLDTVLSALGDTITDILGDLNDERQKVQP